MSASRLRVARPDDAPAMHAIYAREVEHGVATFETRPPGIDAMRERIEARLAHYPWLAWDEAGEVLAYAYASRFRERAAYDWIAEASVYVRADAQRRGIARRLYGALLDTLRLQGMTQVVGVITLPGPASVRLHEALGFSRGGVWRQAGYKHERWWDVGVWQKTLQASLVPPLPVVPFAALRRQASFAAVLQGGS